MKEYILFRCSKKTHVIDKCLEGIGTGVINLWGLQNTTPGKYTLVCEKDTGKVIRKYIGNKSGFPDIIKDPDEYVDLELIEEFTM